MEDNEMKLYDILAFGVAVLFIGSFFYAAGITAYWILAA